MDRINLQLRPKSYSSGYRELERSFYVSEKVHGRRHSKMTQTSQNTQNTENNSRRQSIQESQEKRRELAQMSTVSLDINPQKSYSGLRKQLCQSDNEYKAQKLNKTEETKLQTLKAKVSKEQVLFEKEFTKTAHLFRVQSAKYLREPYDKVSNQSLTETDYANRMANGRIRPNSSPVYSSRFQQGFRKSEKDCRTCKNIQNVIGEYERLSSTNDVDHGGHVHHTRYLFSDRQMRTFINILETSYCADIPEMTEILHKKFHSLEDVDRVITQGTNGNTGKNEPAVQNRIRKFCKSQEVFNKQHPLPENIKLGLEQTRMAQAVATRRRSGAHVSMMSEVRKRLGLSNV